MKQIYSKWTRIFVLPGTGCLTDRLLQNQCLEHIDCVNAYRNAVALLHINTILQKSMIHGKEGADKRCFYTWNDQLIWAIPNKSAIKMLVEL